MFVFCLFVCLFLFLFFVCYRSRLFQQSSASLSLLFQLTFEPIVNICSLLVLAILTSSQRCRVTSGRITHSILFLHQFRYKYSTMQYDAMRLYCQVSVLLHQECLMVPSAIQYNAMRLYCQVSVLLHQECLMVSFSLTFTSIIKTTNLKQDMTFSALKQAPNTHTTKLQMLFTMTKHNLCFSS